MRKKEEIVTKTLLKEKLLSYLFNLRSVSVTSAPGPGAYPALHHKNKQKIWYRQSLVSQPRCFRMPGQDTLAIGVAIIQTERFTFAF